MRTRTSPTSAGTVIQRSSTGSLSIGAAWTSSSTLRASSGVSSYRNGGAAVASTNACEAGSSTMWASVLSMVMRSVLGVDGLGGRGDAGGLEAQLGEGAVGEHDGGGHERSFRS